MTMSDSEMAMARQPRNLNLKGVDYVEFYVGNATQAAHYFRSTFGFKPSAYAGLETGCQDRISFVLEQENIRLVMTSALDPDSPISESVRLHGDSVCDIAFSVDDATAIFEEVVNRGAIPLMEPTEFEEETGSTVKATVTSFGHTVHSFIQRNGEGCSALPGYKPIPHQPSVTPVGLTAIDHVAIGVESGALDHWIESYKTTFGFDQCHQEDVYTEYSAMKSKVLADPTQVIKFVVMEPAPGKRRSQIEEFLKFHRGPGVQHLALLTSDIFGTVRGLRANWVEFLNTPSTYYETLEDRIGDLGDKLDALRQLNILADCDQGGQLMQIFTKPVQSRPTLFFEIIQRLGARGFGGGNIKALFEALEQEQARRGTL